MTISTQLETPAGDRIEVLRDDDLAPALGYDEVNRHYANAIMWSEMRAPVVGALWRHGRYEHRTGFATAKLAADAGLELRQCGAVLKAPVMDFCIDASRRGKRTYHLQLIALPERWIERVIDSEPALRVVPHETIEATHTELVPLTHTPLTPSPLSVIDIDQPALEVAQAVATALLAQVVDIISHGHASGAEVEQLRVELAALSARLGDQVGDSQKLRRQLREASDELVAVKEERDGLRRRAMIAEQNLKTATSGDVNRMIDAEVRKRLDKLMREVPRPGHNGDHE